METEKLQDLVERYYKNRDFINNEETAKMALVVPFLRSLGYDPNNPQEVRLEYRAEFTQSDGKRHADRMDYAIFDKAGVKPLMVIETKPLGTNLQQKCQQLARYLAQMPDLHFGIITDGCHYLFFGDLEIPNQMDNEPFFSLALDDHDTDWAKAAKFLSKFSREAFNAETLVTDAEDSRYRQAMIDKIVRALTAPADDEPFLRWLTHDLYRGSRTTSVMERLGRVAKDAIEPALLRVMSNDFLQKLKQRMERVEEAAEAQDTTSSEKVGAARTDKSEALDKRARGIETTEEELSFHQIIRDICSAEGVPANDIIYRDTVNYFNVSYQRPTKWFLRFFGDSRNKNIISAVPVEEVRLLLPGRKVEEAPGVFGKSRIYIDSIDELQKIKPLIIRSLELIRTDSSQ